MKGWGSGLLDGDTRPEGEKRPGIAGPENTTGRLQDEQEPPLPGSQRASSNTA